MREYLVVFGISLGVTYLLASIARMLAHHFGAVAKVRDRDVHAEPIPYLGGLAMLGGLYAAYLVARHLPFLSTSEEFVLPDAGAVLLAGALVCAVGVIDDIFDLDALTKLGGQVLAAGLLERLEQPVLAREVYGLVPPDHPAHVAAELGRARVLRSEEEDAAALEVLSSLAQQAQV